MKLTTAVLLLIVLLGSALLSVQGVDLDNMKELTGKMDDIKQDALNKAENYHQEVKQFVKDSKDYIEDKTQQAANALVEVSTAAMRLALFGGAALSFLAILAIYAPQRQKLHPIYPSDTVIASATGKHRMNTLPVARPGYLDFVESYGAPATMASIIALPLVALDAWANYTRFFDPFSKEVALIMFLTATILTGAAFQFIYLQLSRTFNHWFVKYYKPSQLNREELRSLYHGQRDELEEEEEREKVIEKKTVWFYFAHAATLTMLVPAWLGLIAVTYFVVIAPRLR